MACSQPQPNDLYTSITYNQTYSNRVRCKWHPGEFITSVCLEKDCDQGLCPSCYSSHFNSHKTTTARLPNILYFDKAIDQTNIVLSSAITQLLSMESVLTQYKTRKNYSTILSQRQKLSKCKAVLDNLISGYFDILAKALDDD